MSGPSILFGATVVIEDEEGTEQTWRIYGEDEVNVAEGVLSWLSPLAQALMRKQAGDAVVFAAPGRRREIEIISVCYEEQEPLPDVLSFTMEEKARRHTRSHS
jgi:transcription elongation factor GreB